MTTPRASGSNPPTPDWLIAAEQVEDIRRLWQARREALDRRDLNALTAALTLDCRCEVVPTGQRWTGHAGARAFYESLLSAFPDMRLVLDHIVIGAQGVFEASRLIATHQGVWAGIAPTQRAIRLRLQIYTPWNPQLGLFEGETVYFDRGEMDELLLT